MIATSWLEKAEALLLSKRVPEARASAEFLLASALGVGRAAAVLDGGRRLSDAQRRKFWSWVEQRARRKPLAYVLGSQPFLGLDIEVSPDVLIPRPETEELVLECERLLKDRSAPRVLEIGTGTGCVAIALAQLCPKAVIFATDVSDKALALAQKNALAHHVGQRVRFIREDLFSDRPGPGGWADLLVSNPPYIPTRELAELEAELRWEPVLALDGGRDGLDAIRAVVRSSARLLKPGGCLALEIGSEQGPAVARLLAEGFEGVHVRRDASGLDRIAIGRRAA